MISLLDVWLPSSLVLLVGAVGMPLLRRRSAALRHWWLLTTLAGAALVPAAILVMPAGVVPAWAVPAWGVPLEVSALGRAPIAAVARPSQHGAPPDAPPAISARLAQQVADVAGRSAIAIWAAGVVASMAILGLGLLRLRRLDARARLLTAGVWHERLAALHPHPPPVVLKVSAATGLLLVWGLRRPTLIVPAAALNWSPERVVLVLQHELAHIERRDWLWQVLSEVVRACYWCNPLVWWACARLRAECERACDDRVIAAGATGADYAAHVVAIARDLRPQLWLPAPTIVRPSTLERRITAMLNKTLDRRPLQARARARILATAAVVTLAVAAVAAQSFVSLTGTIVDPSNGVLPGVTLHLTNDDTKAKYEIRTDRTGRYEFVGLPPGTYQLEALLPGFARFAGRVTVAGQPLQRDLTMTVGTIQETITVRQDAPPLPPDPERDRKIEAYKQRRAQAHVGPPDAPASAGGVRMGGNLRVPLKLRDVRPAYPESLRGTEGVVVLSARISPSGAVDDVDTVSATHPDFAQSAIDAVKQWEFDATLLNGTPIATPMNVTVNYKVR